jgi:hypothetical protein
MLLFLKKTGWGVTPCSFVKMHRCLGWTRCLHLHGRRKMETADFSETHVTMCGAAVGCQGCTAWMAPSWVSFWRTAISGPSFVFTQMFRQFVTGSYESGWYYVTKIRTCFPLSPAIAKISLSPVSLSFSLCGVFVAFVWIIWWIFKSPNVVMLRYVSLCFFDASLCFVMLRYITLCFDINTIPSSSHCLQSLHILSIAIS